MALIVEKLKEKTVITAPDLTEIFGVQVPGTDDWYQISLETIKNVIEGAGYLPDLALVTTNIRVRRDETDTDTTDGIKIIVENLSGNTIQWRSTGVLYSLPSPQNDGNNAYLNLTPPDETNPRYDLVFLDQYGALEVKTGTPSATPVQPTIGANEIGLSFIYIPSEGTGDPEIEGGLSNKNVIFFDKTGKDSNAGRTIDTPVLTLGKAIDLSSSSDLIQCLDAGTYADEIITLDKTRIIDAKNAAISNYNPDDDPTAPTITITESGCIIRANEIIAAATTGDGEIGLKVGNLLPEFKCYLDCKRIEGNLVVLENTSLYLLSPLIVTGDITNDGEIYGVVNNVIQNAFEIKTRNIPATDFYVKNASQYYVTGTGTIALISNQYISDGAVIWLHLLSGVTLTHNATASGTLKPIILASGANYTTTGYTVLQLIHRDGKWYEVATTKSTGVSAENVSYNNGDSGLDSNNVQDAIDEIVGIIETNNSVWKQITDFTAAPASTSTITMTSDLTNTIKPMYGLKYKIGGTFYYGIVKSLTSNLMTIGGISLSSNITELYYSDLNNVIKIDVPVANESFAATGTDILKTKENCGAIELPECYLVMFKVWATTAETGTTKSKIKPMNGANAISSTSDGIEITANATWYDSGVTIQSSYYKYSSFDNFRIDVSQPGSNKNTKGAKFTAYFIIKG